MSKTIYDPMDPIIKKEVTFAKSLGIRVNTVCECDNPFVSLMISSHYNDGIIMTPISFGITADNLIDTFEGLKSLGWCGTRIAKALVHAINDLPAEDRIALNTRCFIRQYKSVGVIKYFVESVIKMIEIQGIVINKRHINIKTARNIWWSLGGYYGLKRLFTDCLNETISELRRIHALEEKLNDDNKILRDYWYWEKLKDLSFKPMKCEKSLCMTCTHCKTNKNGCRTCRKGYIDISTDMTVDEVNKLYKSVFMANNKLCSQHIILPMSECKMYKSRIGYGEEQLAAKRNDVVEEMSEEMKMIQYTMYTLINDNNIII